MVSSGGLNIVQPFEPKFFCSVRLQITWDSAALNTFTINSIFQRKKTLYFKLSALLPNHSKKFENTTECQEFYAQTQSVIELRSNEEVVKNKQTAETYQNVLIIFSLHQ